MSTQTFFYWEKPTSAAPAWQKGQTNSIIEISSSSLKLDFPIVELQKRGISLFNLRKRAKECLISQKRAFAHFVHEIFQNMRTILNMGQRLRTKYAIKPKIFLSVLLDKIFTILF